MCKGLHLDGLEWQTCGLYENIRKQWVGRSVFDCASLYSTQIIKDCKRNKIASTNAKLIKDL